jgi:hypothetical protein
VSFNGSGVFQINTAGQPVVSGTVISSTAFNALTADLATGLSTCVTKDGQTTPTANLPMANYKFTGLGAGTDAGDSATLGQVQSTVVKLIGSVSGTDTITGSLTPALTAYAAGQMFYFVAAGDNTGAVTLNINSLGAKNVTKNGSTALVAGEIKSGQTVTVIYDGTRFQMVNPVVLGLTGITSSTVTALGSGAGDSVTSATGTTAIGKNAGTAITTGISNTFVGEEAGLVCTDGILNTGIGLGALSSLTSASGNSAIGWLAGASITTGFRNTAIGRSSMSACTTGSYNTALGTDALDSTNYDNTTGVGSSSAVTGDNQVQLGDSATTTYAYGAVQDRSDARDKADIQDSNLGLAFVMQLQPRMFRWDMREDYRPPKPDENASQEEWDAWYEACKLANLTHDGTHKRSRFHYGLVAQEVKATMDAMGVDFGGYQDHKVKGGDDVLSLGYEEMIAPLIKAIQELKAEFDAYKATHP